MLFSVSKPQAPCNSIPFAFLIILPPSLIVLLFVFWYCHKRGKEVRLEKERALTEKEAAALDEKLASEDTTPRTTTAPEGAPIEEVRAGMLVRDEKDGEGYAAEGSLAKELERERREKGEKDRSGAARRGADGELISEG